MSQSEKVQPTLQDESLVTADQLRFRFSNLCGTPYSGGSVVFSPEGTSMYSPVSNRVLLTDLSMNRSSTPCPELRSSTDLIVPMPSPLTSSGAPVAKLVLAIDVDGYGMLFDVVSSVILNRINFKDRVICAKFSHDGKYLATATGRRIKVWYSACIDNNWQFVLYRQFAGHIDEVRSLDFAAPQPGKPDLLLSAGADSIVRVWSLLFEELPHSILNDHSQGIVSAHFVDGRDAVVAVNRSGSILVWRRTSLSEFSVESRAHIPAGVGYVTCGAFDAASGVLCLGLSGGAFSLYQIPTMEPIQSFSVGSAVTSVSMSAGGDWVAVGVQDAGQLIVWEWRAENFVFRQQGHHDGVNCVAFCGGNGNTKSSSADLLDVFGSSSVGATFNAGGGLLATGGVEGKVKLWHSLSGFCFVTLSDHTSSVEALAFTPQGNAVLSASMDGSVRAYDLLRYKNFRTFTAPDVRVQFGSLSIDPSGDIVAAGAANGSYAIYLWSLQTGQCLDIFTGHEARISHLRFAPSSNDGILASTSWDSSLRVWNVFATKNKSESLMNQREVSCCAFDPVDGTIAAVATLSGHITFWDTRNGVEVGSIDAIRDIGSGRREGEKFATGALKGKSSKRDGTGTNVNLNQYFSALEYGGAAGRWLVAVARGSAFACVFDPLEKALLARIELTTHFGLSGVAQFLNSRFHSDLAGDDEHETLDRSGKRRKSIAAATALPGVSRGDMKLLGNGKQKRVWRVSGLAVSPDGQEIAVATSEGAYILTLGGKVGAAFQPTGQLTEAISKPAVTKALVNAEYASAAQAALALNDAESFASVFESVPQTEVAAVIAQIPTVSFLPLLSQLALLLHPVEGSPRVDRTMTWLTQLLRLRFNELQKVVHMSAHGRQVRAVLCTILQHVQAQSAALGSLLRDNLFVLKFLAKPTEEECEEEEDEEEEGVMLEDVVAAVEMQAE